MNSIELLIADENQSKLSKVNDTFNNKHIENEKNIYSKSGFLSKLFFFWVFQAILIARKFKLTVKSLGEYDEKFLSDDISNEINEYWKRNSNKSLVKVLLLKNSLILILLFIMSLISSILSTINIYLIDNIISCFTLNEEPIFELKYLSIAYGLSNIMIIFLNRHYTLYEKIISSRSSIQLTSLIFEKTLLVKSNLEEGEVINLIQIGTIKLLDSFGTIPNMIIYPIKVIIYTYLLFKFFGWTFVFGLTVMILLMLISYILTSNEAFYSNIYLELKDKRMNILEEVLNNIKAIKFNGWDEIFQKKIMSKRKEEVNMLMKRSKFSLWNLTLFWAFPTIIAAVSISVYFIFLGEMKANVIYSGMAIFSMLQVPLINIPFSISDLLQMYICIQRIESYLRQEERCNTNIDYNRNIEYSIQLKKCSFIPKSNKKIEEIHEISLKNIELKIKKNELVGIIGETGSGKSLLLKAILNELTLYNFEEKEIDKEKNINDVLSINGIVSYVSQNAWIHNKTIRDNITFYNKYNPEHYKKVLSLCELNDDLTNMTGGDLTEIGDKGANLSGGQKMRVSIARSIYSNSDIYLFDDCLSSLDWSVSENIMNNLILKYLNNKTILFVTNNLQYIDKFDRIILMSKGKIEFNGKYIDLIQKEEYKGIFKNHELNNTYLPEERSSKFIKEDLVENNNSNHDVIKITHEENRQEGSVNIKVYSKFINYMGGYYILIFAFIFSIIWISLRICSDLWMKQWMNNPIFEYSTLNLYVYIGILLLSFLFIFFRLKILLFGRKNSSINIHNDMITNLLKAPINLFYDTEPIGRIINRLSKDIEDIIYIDTYFSGIFAYGALIMSTIIYISYYYPLLILGLPIIIVIGLLLIKLYINPSRELRREKGIILSKQVSLISELLQGTTSIILEKKEGFYRKDLYKYLSNLNTIQIFTGGLESWLGLYMDLSSFLFFISVIIYLNLHTNNDSIDSVVVGQILTYLSSFLDQASLILSLMSGLENYMVSAERCLYYTEIESEIECKNHQNESFLLNETADWPIKGEVEFEDFSVKYRQNLELALKNISFTINPEEKVGILGRSGSGKSTISLCLFRLLESYFGKIKIDKCDISCLPLSKIRSNLTIIPQESVIFNDTLRFNLDPKMLNNNEEIIKIIQDIGLYDLLKIKDINKEILSNNLSSGERQLICIARAILRKTKIIIIDEATSSIDYSTEQKIEKAFNKYFKNKTIITISHRINTIMKYDKIIIIDNGKIIEVGSPFDLIKNTKSEFSKLILKSKSTVNIDNKDKEKIN